MLTVAVRAGGDAYDVLIGAVRGRKGDDSRLVSAGHQPPQGVVARVLGKITLPEHVVACRARSANSGSLRFRQSRDIRSPANRPLDKSLSFQFGVSIANRRAVHLQALRQLAAGFQPVSRLQGSGNDPLAQLLANLNIKRFGQAGIEHDGQISSLTVPDQIRPLSATCKEPSEPIREKQGLGENSRQ